MSISALKQGLSFLFLKPPKRVAAGAGGRSMVDVVPTSIAADACHRETQGDIDTKETIFTLCVQQLNQNDCNTNQQTPVLEAMEYIGIVYI